MKRCSIGLKLTMFSSGMILGTIGVFSIIAVYYLSTLSEIIQQIYDIDDDFLEPVFQILFLVLSLLLIFAFFASVITSLSISSQFLKTISGFIKNIKHIKADGFTNRVEVNGTDELSKLGYEFNTLMDQIETTMNQQTQFISDASHELKTPLTILKGNLEMLQRWGKTDMDVLDNAIKVSCIEVSRLIALCEDLLSLTKHEDIPCERIEISTIIKATCDEFMSSYPDLCIDFVLDETWKHIHYDHIKQLCIVFIDNAIKYAKEDFIQLEIQCNERCIFFKDYGIGIAHQHIDKIFHRFYKVEESRFHKNQSFGLGLSIVKQICDLYDFQIDVTSEEHVFTCFTITFKEEEQ